jgi:FtsH-binding integral membrane protein
MNETGLYFDKTAVRYRTILKNVYIWMTMGLAVTGLVAWYTANSPAMLQILFGNGILPMLLLIIGTFVVVAVLSSRIMTMSVGAAVGSFTLYAVLNGLMLSSVFLAYTKTTIAQAFFVSAGMFGAMSLWAAITKKDLSGWGHYLFMGLIGLIITGIVSIFVHAQAFQIMYSLIGVVLFTLLTAYDTQQIKKMSDAAGSTVAEDDFVRLSIMGALKLYLDFINIFLFLLRLFRPR